MRMLSVALAAGMVMGWGVAGALAGTSSSLMDISTDGTLLACTNRDSGTVTLVDLKTHKKRHEVRLGTKPEGVTFLGDSHRLAAAIYGDDRVTFIDGDSGKVDGSVDVFDEPYGIVSSPDGSRVFVTLDYPGEIVEIDAGSRKVLRSFPAGKFVRGLAISKDGGRLYATEYYTSTVKVFDAADGKLVDESKGREVDNLCRQIVLHPTRPKAYIPHIRSRITAARGEGSIFPYLTAVDLRTEKESRRNRIPMDSFLGAVVTANPWEVAVSPDGKQLYIVFAGTDDMFACNVLDDDFREVQRRDFLRTGRNPRAVKVSPDNKTFYVYNALDFQVVAYDTKSLSPTHEITVTDNPLTDEVLLGKVLFYSANMPMSGRRWISCSSCHPDGEPDGRTWQNPEGKRNTQSLAGMSWTHPIHWSADRDEVQDFEHTIRGPLMQGRGLIRGKVMDSLGKPNSGLSDALDAIAAYCNSHKVPLSPHSKNGLSEAAKRGRELFFSKETKCAECHKGPYFCDSVPDGKFVMHDVGTGDDDPTEKMGSKYDTPTLLGVYRTAPYLHHGTAATLEAVLTTRNKDDRHGKTSQLSKEQVSDLVEFLKALPYEDSESAATAAGMKKVVK